MLDRRRAILRIRFWSTGLVVCVMANPLTDESAIVRKKPVILATCTEAHTNTWLAL